MKHPEIIINNETPFETGERSTYLRYDSLEKMLEGQVKGLSDQAKKDGKKIISNWNHWETKQL